MSDIGACALCSRVAELKESHIIPKFVYDYIKKTSPSPYFRRLSDPNLRVQDGDKSKLLCNECEVKFSAWEENFSSNLFKPFLETTKPCFDYSDWLIKFAISLAWRIATVRRDEYIAEQSHYLEDIDAALRCWGNFLKGNSLEHGRYKHHICLLGPIQPINPLPEYGHMFLSRGIDHALVGNFKSISVYSKLPGMIFWTCILPQSPQGLAGKEIYNDGTLERPQNFEQPLYWDFVVNQIESISDASFIISQKQQEIMDRDIPNKITDRIIARFSPIFEAERKEKLRRENN